MGDRRVPTVGVEGTAGARRRRISEGLHIAVPSAAAGLLVGSGASCLTWSRWRGNLLLSMVIGWCVWGLRARMLRQAQGVTLTPGGTIDDAITFAERALGVAGLDRGGRDGGGVWQSISVFPLAALVYTASRMGQSEGRAWLVETVRRLASSEDNVAEDAWRGAVDTVGEQHSMLRGALVRVAGMERRQRDSVARVICDAVQAAGSGLQR